MHSKSLQLCPTLATLLTVAQQAPLSIGLARQEYWSRLLCPLARNALHLGIKPESSYISCIGRNVLYHYHHLGGTNDWYLCTIFGSNTKKKKIMIKQRRGKVKLRKVLCKIICIETMYRKSRKE